MRRVIQEKTEEEIKRRKMGKEEKSTEDNGWRGIWL